MSAAPKRDAALVLLTLNEVQGLNTLWDQIPVDQFRECFAVDGGSTDGTVEFLTERGIPVVTQPIRGRGVAFRVAAEASSAERLIFFSPDGNEDPADIVRLDDRLIDGARIAIARRSLVKPRTRLNRNTIRRLWGLLTKPIIAMH